MSAFARDIKSWVPAPFTGEGPRTPLLRLGRSAGALSDISLGALSCFDSAKEDNRSQHLGYLEVLQ